MFGNLGEKREFNKRKEKITESLMILFLPFRSLGDKGKFLFFPPCLQVEKKDKKRG